MEKSQKSHPVSPVLLVDDEEYSLQVYEMHLLREGITNVISCRSGKEALDILASQDVSIIILDLYMPEMSGEEVLSVVANKYPQVPVIITTAIDDVATIVRCTKAGAFDYIVKPIDPTRLITTIRRAFEFRDLRQENVLLKESVFNNTLKHPETFSEIITNNTTMRSIFNLN